MTPGDYSISILVRDIPEADEWTYNAMKANPFYSNYAVWDAKIQVVLGTEFSASMSPKKNEYNAGETVTVKWGVNNALFTSESKVRITMSADYGKTYGYVLAEDIPAQNGQASIKLPYANVGNIDVDFITATRQMRGGIIRIEEKDGIAFTLTTDSPEKGGGFTIVGAEETDIRSLLPTPANTEDIYDLHGRKVSRPDTICPGLYLKKGKVVFIK